MSTLSVDAGPGQPAKSPPRLWVLLEGFVLLLAAPFLYFPDIFLPATAVALLVLGIVWIYSLFFYPARPTPFNFIFLLWAVVLGVAILVSADPALTLPKATGVILGLAVWRFVVLAINSRRAVSWGVALFLLLAFGLTLLGVSTLQGLTKIPFLDAINPIQNGGTLLPGGLLSSSGHINQVGGLICLYLPLLISLLIQMPTVRPARGRRWLVVLATLLVVGMLLLTQSRSGWAGSAAGVFALLVLWGIVMPPSGRRRAVRLAAVGVALAGIALVLWIGPNRLFELWINPPQETAIGTLTTLNYRKNLWPVALATVRDFPLTGSGLGAFENVAFRLYPMPWTTAVDVTHAHNVFIQMAVDVGLPGLVIYVAILLTAAVVGWQIARRDERFRAVGLGLLAGLVALLVYGVADTQALGTKPGLIFWFSLGLLAATHRVVATHGVAATHAD